MPVNIALLGSGVFAQASYLPALLALSKSGDLNLHTIWSRSESSVQTLHSKFNPPSGTPSPQLAHGEDALDRILANKEIDAVLFVLPITKQPDLVRKALKAGKHVLSEKPLARDVKDARELVEEYQTEHKPKGLIWRVAENFAHEPVLRFAGDILANTPELGPVLYWDLKFMAYVEDGSKYHATGWRTIPDYQGGFLLDGGVHWTALLRTVLPPSARPASVLGFSSLHRTHLLPHDTLQAISLPPSSSITSPNGPKTKLTTAVHGDKDLAAQPGQSSPKGQILFSFARPDMPQEAQVSNALVVTLLNGVLTVESTPSREWIVTLIPAQNTKIEKQTKSSKQVGVEMEIGMFARAVQAFKNGEENTEENHGEPRGALWDLSVVEAMLTSEGKEVNIERLLRGE